MSMVRVEPYAGGKVSMTGMSGIDTANILNTLNAPGVWLCDKAAENDLPICGSSGIGKYMPYVLSLLVYGAGLVLVMKMAKR